MQEYNESGVSIGGEIADAQRALAISKAEMEHINCRSSLQPIKREGDNMIKYANELPEEEMKKVGLFDIIIIDDMGEIVGEYENVVGENKEDLLFEINFSQELREKDYKPSQVNVVFDKKADIKVDKI